MASRAEQIMQAIVAALTVPPMASVPAAQVYRDLERALDKAITAAVAVEAGDEPPPDGVVIGAADRSLEVRVSALAKGQGATALADAPMVETYNRIMADPTLGGLAIDIEEGATDRERNALEKDVAVITKTYRVIYRTARRSLEN